MELSFTIDEIRDLLLKKERKFFSGYFPKIIGVLTPDMN